jgi:hypothetical protein
VQSTVKQPVEKPKEKLLLVISADDLYEIKTNYEGDEAVEKYNEKMKVMEKLDEQKPRILSYEEQTFNNGVKKLNEQIVQSIKYKNMEMSYNIYCYGILKKYLEEQGYIVHQNDYNKSVKVKQNEMYMLEVRERVQKILFNKILKYIETGVKEEFKNPKAQWVRVKHPKVMNKLDSSYKLYINYEARLFKLDLDITIENIKKELVKKYYFGYKEGTKGYRFIIFKDEENRDYFQKMYGGNENFSMFDKIVDATPS